MNIDELLSMHGFLRMFPANEGLSDNTEEVGCSGTTVRGDPEPAQQG